MNVCQCFHEHYESIQEVKTDPFEDWSSNAFAHVFVKFL